MLFISCLLASLFQPVSKQFDLAASKIHEPRVKV